MKSAVGLVAMLVAAIAAAEAPPAPEEMIPREKLEPAAFPALAAAVRGEMVAGGRYEFVTAKEQLKVEAALQEIESTLSGHASTAELSEGERIAVINAQSEANAILTRRNGDRLICERRTIVGTRFPQTVCETYNEKMRRTAYSRERMREFENVILQKPVPVDQR